MDSFISNLVNYWPHSEDELHLVANSDHPGWINLQSSITADCKFISHNIGKSFGVLFESHHDGIVTGWTDNYIKVNIKGKEIEYY